MGEKNEVKVRLSTVVYLFIILVLVVALGAVYYLGFVKDDNANNMISNGEVTDEVSNSKVDEIAKDLFEKGSHKIRETQYTDYSQYERAQPLTEKTINGEIYEKRNVLYSDVEKEYSEIFTGEALTLVLGKRFSEVDGYLYVRAGGATGWTVKNIKLTRTLETNDEIEYIVTYTDVEIENSFVEEYSCKMTVKLVDGNYRISKTDYMGLDNLETNNTEKEEINENKVKEGIYSFANTDRKDAIAQNNKFTPILLETYIKFENNDFKVYDNGQIFTSGKYEKTSDNLIKCVISDERSFEIKVMGNNELEITKLNSNDAETEFNIRLYDILGEENEYVLYEETDLVGTWSTKYVYKDMGGGDFWKTEEHQIDETFTFNNDGTYKVKEYRAVEEGTYELEKNQIHISHDKSEGSKMYLIDKDTILYTLGTEYKIILSKNS